MFKEILKIQPQLDEASASAMERQLSTRFKRVAKSFGGGLLNVIKGGGIAGSVIGLLERILNPIQQVQESINGFLAQSDDLVTFGKEFNTDPGKLAKLVALSKSTGLDQDTLFQMINKFHGAIAEAKADPTKQSAVRQFVNIPDTADAFFEFIQSLHGMTDSNKKLLAQNEVFGERNTLKMSDFINETNWKGILETMRALPSEQYSRRIKPAGGLNDLRDTLAGGRYLRNIVDTGDTVHEGMVYAEDRRERESDDRMRTRMGEYKTLDALQEGFDKIGNYFEQILTQSAKGWTEVIGIGSIIKSLPGSRAFRGLFPKKAGE